MLIGEVAGRTGVSARMLRHYDALGLVRPTGRTAGGYREYAAEDLRRIFHVESLRSLGMSLRQIGRALEDPAFTPSTLVGDLIRQTEERLAREQELLERLRTVDTSSPAGWEGVLRLVELLHGLHSPSAARRQQTILASANDAPVPAELLAEALLAESDPNVAGALRWALARSSDSAAVASLALGLRSAEVDIRRRAVRAIAEMPGAEATAALTAALTDSDAAVHTRAALTLGARGETAAAPTLVQMVVDGANDVEASEVLGRLALAPEHADPIVGALVDELAAPAAEDPAVRIRLIQALAEMPGTIARSAVRRSARDDDPAVALIAGAIASVLDGRSDS